MSEKIILYRPILKLPNGMYTCPNGSVNRDREEAVWLAAENCCSGAELVRVDEEEVWEDEIENSGLIA